MYLGVLFFEMFETVWHVLICFGTIRSGWECFGVFLMFVENMWCFWMYFEMYCFGDWLYVLGNNLVCLFVCV